MIDATQAAGVHTTMIRYRGTTGPCAGALLTLALGLSGPAGAQSGRAPTAVIDGLMWATESNGETIPWEDANAYCETLELDGHDDWRLPTLAEAESLYDPDAPERLRSPIELADCCAWSSANLVEIEADRKGVLPDPVNPPAGYYWGFLFSQGIRYYSFGRFPDGEALCVRESDG